jgi:penicillin-binding protein A
MRSHNPKVYIQRLLAVILAAFALVGSTLVFWSAGAGPSILQREDNPRLVEAALRIQRGQILDANREPLAYTSGPANRLRRIYPIANIGPAVGYYSFRHGTTGIEQGYDAVLRGESDDYWFHFRRRLLHEPQVGRDVRLTLHARRQGAADTVLGDHPGALILLALPDGSSGASDALIVAMASHPGYDPNQLDERFEALLADGRAPLLNRVTQGRYQPGLVLQPFLLATAVDRNVVQPGDLVPNAGDLVRFNQSTVSCTTPPPDPATWRDVLQNACPAPMLSLVSELGAGYLQATLQNFGLLAVPDLSLPMAAPPERVIDDLLLAAVGQDVLTVTPLQISLALAALANEGVLPRPRLVTAVQDVDGRWQAQPPKAPVGPAVSPGAARAIRDAFTRHDDLLEFATLVLAGPEASTNAWYLALAPAISPRYAVVVVIENSQDPFTAQRAGRALLRALLAEE